MEMGRIMGLAEIARHLGVSKERVSQLARRPDFPPTLCMLLGQPELEGGKIYFEESILAWEKTWNRKPGRPRIDMS